MGFQKVLVTFILLRPFAAQAQNLNDLENAARAVGGVERVEKLLVAADAAYSQQAFDRSFDLATEAEEFAQRINAPVPRAQALNRQGKALQRTTVKRGLFRKEKPANRFIQSNEVLRKAGASSNPLFLENLGILHDLALKSGNNSEAEKITADIERIRNGGAAYDAPVTRQELKQELRSLSTELQTQKYAKDTTAAFAARLVAESQSLQAQLQEKEAAINQMTESQMKVELMLMQQRSMLDSLLYRSRVDSLMLTNQNLALSEAKASRNFSYAIAAALLLLFGGVLYSLFRARQNARILSDKNEIIETERNRSDRLLLNILPESVATELKQKGSTSARFYDDVSVLFADFVNFTSIAERISPQQLVSDLDTCFRAFDNIIEKYDLEKIKTIGDAYLCAGGLRNGKGNQVLAMVNAAREMQEWLREWNIQRRKSGLPVYEARVGIHSGAVVAGVVGARKFAFDIWGDTVNIAARVEQAGEAGRINLSGTAHAALNNQVACDFRGKIPVKNKADIEMFFVS